MREVLGDRRSRACEGDAGSVPRVPPRSSAPPHRVDRDRLHQPAAAHPVDLALEVHPGADVDRQDLHVVPDTQVLVLRREREDAVAKLSEKIIKGGSGVWGPVPMPANTQVSPAEAETLVKWILTTK